VTFLEVAADQVGAALGAAEVAGQGGVHFGLVLWPPAPESVALGVVVQHFVGIELGTVAGKVEQLQVPNMRESPGLNDLGSVNGCPSTITNTFRLACLMSRLRKSRNTLTRKPSLSTMKHM